MIEMLGVLAIIGVLSVGGIAGYSKAMMKFKTNKTIDQIAMTVTNIRTLYAQQNTYAGLDTTIAQKMGIVDDAMANGTGALKNAFNGTVEIKTGVSGATGEPSVAQATTIGGVSVAAGKHGAFLLSFQGLPREACVAIATNDWGSNYSAGMLGIRAASTALSTDFDCYVASTSGDTKTAMAALTDVATSGSEVSYRCAASNSPMTVSQAAAACKCANTNTCSITLKYY